MILTATALSLGFLHGLGADHLMAIAALAVNTDRSAGDGRREPIRVAVRFALGHALVLLVGAGAVLLLGWQIPELVERTGRDRRRGAADSDGRLHAVGRRRRAALRPHAPRRVAATGTCTSAGAIAIRRRPRTPSRAGLLGAVFAVSGLRALTLLGPELSPGGATASLLTLLYLVGVFALGILLSMSLFGIVLSRVLGSEAMAAAVGRGAALVTAVASIALGVYWVSV